jgi:hypothetical protein
MEEFKRSLDAGEFDDVLRENEFIYGDKEYAFELGILRDVHKLFACAQGTEKKRIQEMSHGAIKKAFAAIEEKLVVDRELRARSRKIREVQHKVDMAVAEATYYLIEYTAAEVVRKKAGQQVSKD